MEVVVNISLATICFFGQCHPVLVGSQTPSGVFPLQQARITAPGYGGDVLLFARRKDKLLLAVHRVWLGKPSENRMSRLQSPNSGDRRGITGGCINVDPLVYDQLVDCCRSGTLRIEP